MYDQTQGSGGMSSAVLKGLHKVQIPVKTKSIQIISNNDTLQWTEFLLLNISELKTRALN